MKLRKTRVYVKEEDKDEKYYLRRERNNEYARRSRSKKKKLEKLREKTYNQLVKDFKKVKKSHQDEICKFKSEIFNLKSEICNLKSEICKLEEDNENLRIQLSKTENLSLFSFDIDNDNYISLDI